MDMFVLGSAMNKLTVASGKSYEIAIPKTPKSNYRDLYKDCENPYLNLGSVKE